MTINKFLFIFFFYLSEQLVAFRIFTSHTES